MEPQRKYCTILIKRRISGEPGPPVSLNSGELAFNENDSVLYTTINLPLSGKEIIDQGFF